ncbi:hypothetical protein WMY93_010051 [Mugilogobius chulae]|uniref:Uncharacterized protein n=1 Tax=Mugilogobius chulae TaxID=88201 RepID=A0AAW0PF87_9GOBI
MAPVSAAERQRRYRARRNADTEKRQKYLESERQRWQRNKELGKKKLINDLSDREKRQQRKKWRENNRKRKEAKAKMKNLDTPPLTPDIVQEQKAKRVESAQRSSDGPCTQYKQKGNVFLFCTQLAQRGITGGTWNFFEASHGKGAPDGVGGTLKRKADKLVSKGRDIPDAKELFKALTEEETTVKLFYVESEDVEQAVQRMPKEIPPVPSIMKTHQMVTTSPGEITYREISCLCSTQKQLACECFSTLHYTVSKPPAKMVKEGIAWESEDIIGKWCVLMYENDLYPGIIINTDETHALVKCMHKAGANRFYWPPRDDILWYLFDDVLQLIHPPQPVTSRHMEIQKDVYKELAGLLQ